MDTSKVFKTVYNGHPFTVIFAAVITDRDIHILLASVQGI